MRFNFQLLLVAVVAVGVLAAWLHGSGDSDAKPGQGRLRQLGWYLAFAALGVSVIAAVTPLFESHAASRWLLLVALVVALVLALRPALARRIVPVALIVLGLAGLVLARGYAVVAGSPDPVSAYPATAAAAPGIATPLPSPRYIGAYGATPVGNFGIEQHLVLPQAYLFLLVGGWLVWHSRDPVLARGRLLLGRAADLAPRAQLRALWLLPVTIVAAEFFIPGQVSGAVGTALWLAVPVVAAAAVLRRWPGAAARLAAVGLLCLGLGGVGLVLARQDLQDFYEPSEYGLVVMANHAAIVAVAIQALGLLALGVWLTPRAFPAAGRLMGLAPDAELTRQVRQLTESRAVVVDTAASDLRRLERDLHDGAQARLVALGMSLRAAERLIPVNADAALALVVEAREASARALTELRELVRGVHPPVLADRGLGDAVRALALDCPLAVETHVDLPGRLPAPVETACYFAVAELLTNAAKHSSARDASVDVAHANGTLRIEVTDFGLGGADAAAGGGLAGVEKRLAAFDGIMAISSPGGGPTIVVLEVPCVLSSPKTSSC
ncbi:MAG: histidine kinase [Streptosporangiaceae bacterium]